MKKLYSLIIAIIGYITAASAQKADSVWFDKAWKLTTSPADYFYLRTIIKQNDTVYLVTDYYPNHRPQMTGTFASLKPENRNGLFTYYRQDGVITGKMLWVNNMVAEIYRYDNNGKETDHTIQAEYLKTLTFEQKKARYGIVDVDKDVEYADGTGAIANFLKANIRYPREAQRQKIEGRVFVSVLVDENGKPVEYTVVKGVNPLLDTEALRVVKLLPGKWIPAQDKGQNVKRPFTMPVYFSLN